MFDIFTNLAKAAVGVITAPVAIAADVVTLGGSLNDRPRTYTEDQATAVLKALAKAVETK